MRHLRCHALRVRYHVKVSSAEAGGDSQLTLTYVLKTTAGWFDAFQARRKARRETFKKNAAGQALKELAKTPPL